MHIEWVKLRGFRNFRKATINLRENVLIIGANDVGKTNLLHGLRILLDRTISESAMDPEETDFYIGREAGKQSKTCEILVKFCAIDKDAVLSTLKGYVSDEAETFIKYEAVRSSLSRKLFIGSSETLLEEIQSRFYLKYISLRYVKSQRDLAEFIRSERKHLLRLSKEERNEEARSSDEILLSKIGTSLREINSDVRNLTYVEEAMNAVNKELKKLSRHHEDYSVRLDTGAIQTSHFIDRLELTGMTGESRVGVGGDGRNNQILMALWKAKSEREHDVSSECLIYCVEEPEAHLHPHQQRRMAAYLAERLSGQVIVSSHSPQIAAEFRPDAVVRLLGRKSGSYAASEGCSTFIEATWIKMGYRMSIVRAECFFADKVLLVEGPSETQFYHALARELEIDLDFHNLSVLAVDGIDFQVYRAILDAMDIPWAMRTDNDVCKVQRSDPSKWRLMGLNRALKLAGMPEYEDIDHEAKPSDLAEEWKETSEAVNAKGIFVSKQDLEHDLVVALTANSNGQLDNWDCDQKIAWLQQRKAVHMGKFLAEHSARLKALRDDELAEPLLYLLEPK